VVKSLPTNNPSTPAKGTGGGGGNTGHLGGRKKKVLDHSLVDVEALFQQRYQFHSEIPEVWCRKKRMRARVSEERGREKEGKMALTLLTKCFLLQGG
jgi:hypothetical protein